MHVEFPLIWSSPYSHALKSPPAICLNVSSRVLSTRSPIQSGVARPSRVIHGDNKCHAAARLGRSTMSSTMRALDNVTFVSETTGRTFLSSNRKWVKGPGRVCSGFVRPKQKRTTLRLPAYHVGFTGLRPGQSPSPDRMRAPPPPRPCPVGLSAWQNLTSWLFVPFFFL